MDLDDSEEEEEGPVVPMDGMAYLKQVIKVLIYNFLRKFLSTVSRDILITVGRSSRLIHTPLINKVSIYIYHENKFFKKEERRFLVEILFFRFFLTRHFSKSSRTTYTHKHTPHTHTRTHTHTHTQGKGRLCAIASAD